MATRGDRARAEAEGAVTVGGAEKGAVARGRGGGQLAHASIAHLPAARPLVSLAGPRVSASLAV